jgi:hypothetical protein
VRKWSRCPVAVVVASAIWSLSRGKGNRADISEPQRSTHGEPSDKGDKPIIDITGEIARETFGKTSHVIVSYRVGRITIKSED